VAHQSVVGDDATVGPFAVLEPGTRLAPGAVTRPFFVGGAGSDGF